MKKRETNCLLECSNFSEKDFPVLDSLAELIHVACTAHPETESILDCYKIRENCKKASTMLVNQEIWKILKKRTHASKSR